MVSGHYLCPVVFVHILMCLFPVDLTQMAPFPLSALNSFDFF